MVIKSKQSYLYFFVILNALGLMACFINIRLGILSSVIILLMVVTHLDISLFISDCAFVTYLVSSVVSLIAYAWNGRPINIFFAALSFNVIPTLLYYLGKVIKINGKEKEFVDKILDAFIFMMFIGTVAYIVFPNFYYSHLGQAIESYTNGIKDYRYGSYISSIALGSVGVISIAVYFYAFDRLKFWKKIMYLPLILINVIMCMQRSAWIASIIMLIGCILLRFGVDQKTRLKIIGVVILLFGLGLLIYYKQDLFFTETQIESFNRRIGTVNVNEMISSRSDQWSKAFEIIKGNLFIGYGLGSCGQKAAPYGLAVITDGNHLRIFAEIGIFGFLSFVLMNVKSILNSIRSRCYIMALLLIMCNVTAIGSPIFDQYYASFAFWILLGCASIKSNKRL